MFCFKCGTKLPDGALFCHSCGAKCVDLNSLGSNSPNTIPDTDTNSVYSAEANTAKELISASTATATASAGTSIAAAAVNTGVGAAKTAVKTKLIFTTIVAALVTAGIILYNMFFVTTPMKTVDKFISAVNDKDINTAMECMDPKYEKLYKAGTGLLGNIIGFDIKDVFDSAPAIFDIAKANGMKADMKIEKTKVIKEEKNGDRATIVIEIKGEATDENGKADVESGQVTFQLQKFDDDGWRITYLK